MTSTIRRVSMMAATVTLLLVGLAAPAHAASGSCRWSQNGRSVTFNCVANGGVRVWLYIDCISQILPIFNYTHVYRSTFGPGSLMTTLGCPLTYNTYNPSSRIISL